jgi:hypothetical protein
MGEFGQKLGFVIIYIVSVTLGVVKGESIVSCYGPNLLIMIKSGIGQDSCY